MTSLPTQSMFLGWKSLGLFLVIFLPLTWYMLHLESRITTSIALSQAAQGTNIPAEDFFQERRLTLPDMNLDFSKSTPDWLFHQIAMMGITGRELYLDFNAIDLAAYLWLAGYLQLNALFCVFQLTGTSLSLPLLVPLIMNVLSDIIESSSVRYVVSMYPQKSLQALQLIAIATPVKFAMLGLNILMVIWALFKYFTTKQAHAKRVSKLHRRIKQQ